MPIAILEARTRWVPDSEDTRKNKTVSGLIELQLYLRDEGPITIPTEGSRSITIQLDPFFLQDLVNTLQRMVGIQREAGRGMALSWSHEYPT